jgi:hypothetical protein
MAPRGPGRLGPIAQVGVACSLSVAAVPGVALLHGMGVWRPSDVEVGLVLGIVAVVLALLLGPAASVLAGGLAAGRGGLR